MKLSLDERSQTHRSRRCKHLRPGPPENTQFDFFDRIIPMNSVRVVEFYYTTILRKMGPLSSRIYYFLRLCSWVSWAVSCSPCAIKQPCKCLLSLLPSLSVMVFLNLFAARRPSVRNSFLLGFIASQSTIGTIWTVEVPTGFACPFS